MKNTLSEQLQSAMNQAVANHGIALDEKVGKIIKKKAAKTAEKLEKLMAKAKTEAKAEAKVKIQKEKEGAKKKHKPKKQAEAVEMASGTEEDGQHFEKTKA